MMHAALPGRFRIAPRLWPWLIAAAAVGVYAGTFGYPFIFDDRVAVTGNRALRTLWPVTLTARWLVDYTFRLNYAIAQLNPADYRLVNVAIHAANALLLYGALRRLLDLPRVPPRTRAAATPLAGVTALLWAVHPLATQAVTYVCQRYESLMATFMLATVYTFTRGVTARNRTARRLWFDAAVLLCLLGMGTKEVMAMTPFVVLALDLVVTGASWTEPLRRRWRVHLALFLTVGALLAFELRMMGTLATRSASLVPAVSPLRYLATQTGVLTHYLSMSVWPTGLSIDYAWPLITSWRQVWLAALFVVALGVLTLVLALRRRPAAMPGLWFFLVLAPSSSFIPVADPAFDHRMYLPLAGVLLAAVLAVWHVVDELARGRSWGRPLLAALALAAVTGAGTLTVRRNTDYRSVEAMSRSVIAAYPHNHRQRLALIMALHADERLEDAAAECLALLDYTGRQMQAGPADAWVSASLPAYHHAVGLEELARVRLSQGRPGEAAALLERSWAARPGRPTVAHNLAIAYFMVNRRNAALAWAERATRMDAGRGGARAFLAFLLVLDGRYADARLAYQQALAAQPGLLSARLELAWLLATCPEDDVRDGPRALEEAQRVLAVVANPGIRPRQALAAALAECGRFEEAAALVSRALTAARARQAAGKGPAADTVTPWGPSLNPVVIDRQLDNYRAGRALRDA